MPMYLCSQLITDAQGNQDCVQWSEYVSFTQEYAITREQAEQLTLAILLALVAAWVIQKIAHVIQGRRY